MADNKSTNQVHEKVENESFSISDALNPFKNSKSSAESISSGDSSVKLTLNSKSKERESLEKFKDNSEEDIKEKSTIEVLSNIHKILSETGSTINKIFKDTETLIKHTVDNDVSSDLENVNAQARKNETSESTTRSSPVTRSSSVTRSRKQKEEEESSILDKIKKLFTGEEKGKKKKEPSAKKNRLEKESPSKKSPTAKKVEEKGLWDKLKGAFTGPKAKKIAGGAAIGGAAASIPGDTPTFYDPGDKKEHILTEEQKKVYNKVLAEAQRQELTEDETEAALALAYHESKFEEDAIGPKTNQGRAYGVYQYMPNTATGLGFDQHDTEKNIEHGIKDFKRRNRKYGTKPAFAAHQAGEGVLNPDGSLKYNPNDKYQDTITYQKQVDETREHLKRQRGQNQKNNESSQNNNIGNIPQESSENTSSTKPEITGKTGKRVPLTGDTNRNPYFGKETTPFEENNTEQETASPFIHTAYNPDSEPAGTFSGAQFPNNESKPKKSTQNELKPLGYTLSGDYEGGKNKIDIQTRKKTASPFIHTAYNPDSEPAGTFSGAQFPNNESKPKKSTQNELKPLGYTLSDDYEGGKNKIDIQTRKKTKATPEEIKQFYGDGPVLSDEELKQKYKDNPNFSTDDLRKTSAQSEDNSKYSYYKDSNGKNVKENMETGEETSADDKSGKLDAPKSMIRESKLANGETTNWKVDLESGEETSADDESGKLDAPKSMIRESKLANGETTNWKVDLESGEETLATEDDIKQDKQQKQLEKQYDEKKQASSTSISPPEAKTDPLSYTVETPGENSKVTTTKGSSSKSPTGFMNASETTTVTTTGGGSTLHVQEQSEEEKAKLAKETGEETLATEDDIKQDKQQKQLEKQYDEKKQASSTSISPPEAKTDPLSYTVETPGENSKVTTSKKHSSKSPGEFRNASETTSVTTTGGGSTLHVQEQSEEEKAKLAKETGEENEKYDRRGSDAAYDPYENAKSNTFQLKRTKLDHPLKPKEQEVLDVDSKRVDLLNERKSLTKNAPRGAEKPKSEEELDRLSKVDAELKELKGQRDKLVSSKEFQDSVGKGGKSRGDAGGGGGGGGGGEQQRPSRPKGGGGGKPRPKQSDDPTIKMMEEGISIHHTTGIEA